MSPAQYDNLHSTLTEVLATVWKNFCVDPSTTGQVIIRPRFVADRDPTYDIDGKLVPQDAPSNVGIVEVLGTVAARRHLFGEDRLLTTHVALFRDGDLEYLGGVIGP